MFRFKLFGYPVRVEWMFWIVTGLLGSGLMRVPGPKGLGMILIWVGVVFISILWHELGHAYARKRFRAPYSEIMLYGFGGLCGGPGHFTRREDMIISAAGPAAGLLLGGATWLITLSPGYADFWVHFFVRQMLWVNIWWSLVNLLPILPLDGGRIFEAFMANRNPPSVPKVGMIAAGLVAVYGLSQGRLYLAFMFGFLAYSNWQRTQGIRPQF